MRALFDTSALLPVLLESLPNHRRARERFHSARAGRLQAFISQHAVAELYATLSVFPVSPRISLQTVERFIQEDVLKTVHVVSLTPTDYSAVTKRLVRLALPGGIYYDALHVRAAEKEDVDVLFTFDVDDFRRVWPEGAEKIREP
jgi:predicted nucleic acid-binding protein